MIQGLQSLASARPQRSTAWTLGVGILVPFRTRMEQKYVLDRMIVSSFQELQSLSTFWAVRSLNFRLLLHGYTRSYKTDSSRNSGRQSIDPWKSNQDA